MEKNFYIEDADLVEKIQRLHYDVQAHKDILTWLIQNNTDVSSTKFQQYHDEYRNLYEEYDKAKQELEDKYIIPKTTQKVKWQLNFHTHEVTLE